jgi:hypothetical protein
VQTTDSIKPVADLTTGLKVEVELDFSVAFDSLDVGDVIRGESHELHSTPCLDGDGFAHPYRARLP